MTKSDEVEDQKPGEMPKKVGHIKMVVIPDLLAETIDQIVSRDINKDAKVVSDGTKFHTHFPKMFKEYIGRAISSEEIGKVLPLVHKIANEKYLPRHKAGVPSGVSK